MQADTNRERAMQTIAQKRTVCEQGLTQQGQLINV